MLDYFGDLGGLVTALYRGTGVLIAPLATISVNRELLNYILNRQSGKKRSSLKEDKDAARRNQSTLVQLKKRFGIHNNFFCCYCNSKQKRYRRLVRIAEL